MFIKYNSVLRGLTSNFPVFQKMAVELCCSTPVVCQFSRRVPDPCDPGAAAAYAAPFAEAARSMNRYTTAVHCINSAVLKLGQLAKVQPLYRGLHGFDVPKVFRTANEHGVRGGVEMGFMSTTPTRETAVTWAQGGGGFKEKDCSKVAMLFEIEQDIINRGANLAWLSEYPHEREILFGPFCALEVMSERWEGDIMLFSLRVHLNLLATPLEVVIQRRKQALLDSAVSKALQVQSELERRGIEAAEVAEAQRAVLEQISSYVEAQPAAHYNKDHNLAMAQTHIDEIVNVALSDEKLVSPPQQRAMAAALAESSAPVLGKPCELISGQPKSAAMGLYHFMRVRDPFAEEGTAKLEAEIVGFVARLKEHAARVKQHSVLVRLLDKAGPELAHLAEDLTGDASESIHEIEYFRAISWLPKGASPTEVVQVVENELHGNLKYILYDECSEVYVQGPNATRDKGRGKVRFGDFMASAEVKDAELTGSHVAALRLYTTLAYKYINAPLRSQNVYYNVHKPHPLPLTVAYIAEGIKKLRAAYAVKVTNQLVKPATALWRGMKNLKMAGEFMATGDNGKPNGGTELAPMSTSTDIAVAARYASSGDSLLFKISLDNFMQYGAEIKWLSAFPGEEEVLYPPLTYLQPTGKPPQVVQLPTGQKFTVYEVKPTLP